MQTKENDETERKIIAVTRVGVAIWVVRRSGKSLGFYHAAGDANRAAKAATRCVPDCHLHLTEVAA